MPYCPECGADHHAGERAEQEATRAEVEIERIRADKEVRIAQITSKAAVAIGESDAAAESAHAEGVVEGVEAMADVVTPGAPETPGAEVMPEPIVAEPEPGPEPPPLPPPVTETTTVHEEKKAPGWWDSYR